MAAFSTLHSLLSTLTESLNSASNALPTTEALAPPTNGISLLDTKNELFLSYLHNLVFLIVLKIRQAKEILANNETPGNEEEGKHIETFSTTVRKLVELRVYLERGVKPLESRLRYQIDKVVRTADEAAAKPALKQTNGTAKPSTKPKSQSKKRPSTTTSDSDASSTVSESESESETTSSNPTKAFPSDLAYRPNLAAFARPSSTSNPSSTPNHNPSTSTFTPYRPPRIAPTSLPPPPGQNRSSPPPRSHRPKRSTAVDEYISSTLSSAPLAEPSIGSTIQKRGAGGQLTTRERTAAAERTRYEEENFMRLPGMSKKERKKADGERVRKGQFGGEEWVGLGDGADRVLEVTKRRRDKDGDGMGGRGVLERSRGRKRERDNEDDTGEGIGGGGGGGGGFGKVIERKRRRMEGRERRKNRG